MGAINKVACICDSRHCNPLKQGSRNQISKCTQFSPTKMTSLRFWTEYFSKKSMYASVCSTDHVWLQALDRLPRWYLLKCLQALCTEQSDKATWGKVVDWSDCKSTFGLRTQWHRGNLRTTNWELSKLEKVIANDGTWLVISQPPTCTWLAFWQILNIVEVLKNLILVMKMN
jgi:hypothetical protein